MKSTLTSFVLATLLSIVLSNQEGDILIDMKIQLNAYSNQFTDWIPNDVTPCNWNSVYCDGENNVISVTLANVGFNGTLSPRIGELAYLTALSLPGNMISGQIPEQFGNLSSLRSLILENNHLTGNIPDSLGKLSKIQTLILSQNNLSGNIPDSLSSLSNLNDIGLAYNHLTGQIPNRLFQVARYNFTGNNLNCSGNFPSLCASNTSDTGGSHCSKILVILGSIGGAIVLILGAAIFLLVERRRGLKQDAFVDVPGEDGRRIAFGQLKRFSWRELEIATDSFNDMNIVGKGAFGNVYEGVLHDNKKIAVKRLNDCESSGGETAFLRELELISVAVHRNLLRLIGFCTTPTERLLVYPFMQNLSVAYRLRGILACG